MLYDDFRKDNPLLPKYLLKFVAFSTCFLVPLYSFISYFIYQKLKRNLLNKKVVLALLLLTILHFLFGGYLVVFINQFNPYGN